VQVFLYRIAVERSQSIDTLLSIFIYLRRFTMNFNMTKIAAALALTVAASAAQAVVVGPTNMQITSATFGMGAFTGGKSFAVALIGTNDISDQYNPAGWNTAAAQTTGVMASGASLSFAFGTGATDQVNAFFDATAPGATGGGLAPVFNGTLVNGNVSSIDMNSFFANWGGTNFNQGNAAQTGNGNNPLVTNLTLSGCTVSGCNWTMSWKSTIHGGPFDTQKGTWGMSGTISAVAAVPEASTYGMMMAGLGLVGFAARRRTRRVA
jgi:hypothetical protein